MVSVKYKIDELHLGLNALMMKKLFSSGLTIFIKT
jgi:hypothetical protein